MYPQTVTTIEAANGCENHFGSHCDWADLGNLEFSQDHLSLVSAIVTPDLLTESLAQML